MLMLLGGYGWFIHLGNPLPTMNQVERVWEEGQDFVQSILDIVINVEARQSSTRSTLIATLGQKGESRDTRNT